jgi:hypothetical protein
MVASDVGKLILKAHFKEASEDEEYLFAQSRYSGKTYIQEPVPTAMRRTGIIIVTIDKGNWSKAIKPRDQIRDMITEISDTITPLSFFRKQKRINSIIRKAMGVSVRKSFSVWSARAFETNGIPI